MKHVAGNLRSRFTEFLTSDGEKPDRDRDAEFEMPEPTSRERILADWNAGWAVTLASVEALTPADLDRTISIRGEAFLVVEALNRSITHTAYHVGQIVTLARHFAGGRLADPVDSETSIGPIRPGRFQDQGDRALGGPDRYHRIPDFFRSQNHCGHILAAHEPLADEIFRCLLDPVQIILAARVALANGETSISVLFPAAPS